jgi:hypothetical protein
LQDFWSDFGLYIVNIGILIIILIIYKLIVRLVKKGHDDVGLSASSAHNIIFIIRVIFFAIGIGLTISILSSALLQIHIDPLSVISISAVIGTAIGLALAKALGNLISGLYVLVSRPFKIGDYVKIGEEEGIVEEITLSYTRLLCANGNTELIPNSSVTSSKVVNYRINYSTLEKICGEWPVSAIDESCLKKLKTLDDEKKSFYMYTFDLSLRIDWPLEELKKIFNQVVRKWEKIFGYRPIYILKKIFTDSQTFTFSLIVENPELILSRKGDYLEDVIKKLQENFYKK